MKRTFKQFMESQPIDDWLSENAIGKIWEDANDKVFGGSLTKPKFSLEDDLNYIAKRYTSEEAFGDVLGFCDRAGSRIVLQFSKKIKDVKQLLEAVLHEMVHQSQAEETSYLKMHDDPHGEYFLSWKDKVNAYHNTPLRANIP